MKWNVYYHDINRDKIEVFNIFNHSSFRKDVEKYLSEYTNKEEFKEKLKRSLSYYFWCKAEWEIVISPWVGGRNTKEVKIDVYDQVMNNWDIFVDYCWNKKASLYTPISPMGDVSASVMEQAVRFYNSYMNAKLEE